MEQTLESLKHECVANQHQCLRCQKWLCWECCSKLDPSYCIECIADVTVKDDTFTRTETDFNEKTNVMTTTTARCRHISFVGADWVWHSKSISTMSDEDLKARFEYYRATVAQMELEITTRRIKKTHQMYSLPGQPRTFTVTTKREVKTTKTSKNSKEINLGALATALKKLKLTPEQLKQLFPEIA